VPSASRCFIGFAAQMIDGAIGMAKRGDALDGRGHGQGRRHQPVLVQRISTAPSPAYR
jgi:hypothetical protein